MDIFGSWIRIRIIIYGDPQHCELMSWSWSRSGLLFSGLRFTPKTGRLRLPNPSPRTAIVSTNVMRKVFTTISHVRGLHSTVQGSVKFDRQTSQCRGCKNINFSRRKNWMNKSILSQSFIALAFCILILPIKGYLFITITSLTLQVMLVRNLFTTYQSHNKTILYIQKSAFLCVKS